MGLAVSWQRVQSFLLDGALFWQSLIGISPKLENAVPPLLGYAVANVFNQYEGSDK